jgi:hypothetical protein
LISINRIRKREKEKNEIKRQSDPSSPKKETDWSNQVGGSERSSRVPSGRPDLVLLIGSTVGDDGMGKFESVD